MRHSFPVLQAWMHDKLSNVDGIVDDLHVDEIDAQFKPKWQWVPSVLALIPYVFSKSLAEGALCRIAIAIPLNTKVDAGLFSVAVPELDTMDLCFTPPSVYVAPLNTNFFDFGPWKDPSNQVRMIEGDPWKTGDPRLRYVLVDSVSFDNPVRTLWIYAAQS